MFSKDLLFVVALAVVVLSLTSADQLGDKLQQMPRSELHRLFGQGLLIPTSASMQYRTTFITVFARHAFIMIYDL